MIECNPGVSEKALDSQQHMTRSMRFGMNMTLLHRDRRGENRVGMVIEAFYLLRPLDTFSMQEMARRREADHDGVQGNLGNSVFARTFGTVLGKTLWAALWFI